MTLQPYQEHQARHPWLTAGLFIAMFIPAILLVVALGLGLKHLVPEPRSWQIALAAPLVILVFTGGMLARHAFPAQTSLTVVQRPAG